MTVLNLEILAGVGAILAAIILIKTTRERDMKSVWNYVAIGLFALVADLIIELIGTTSGRWTYYKSAYMLFGRVPVELTVIFFASGVLLRYAYLSMARVKYPVHTSGLLIALTGLGLLTVLRGTYFLETEATTLLIAIPLGLWGLHEIRTEQSRVSAIALGTLIAVVDIIIESLIIAGGSYSYASGFTWETPVVYFLFVIGICGALERMDRLEAVLKYKALRAFLRAIGIQREAYSKQLKAIEQKAIKKIKRA